MMARKIRGAHRWTQGVTTYGSGVLLAETATETIAGVGKSEL